MDRIAQYHLPGLFEFYELYRVFLPLYCTHRDWFYPWCDIASLYGSPADCLWGGGRVGGGDVRPQDALALAQEYGISARLTFSNSLLQPEHLSDPTCNKLCRLFAAWRHTAKRRHCPLGTAAGLFKTNVPQFLFCVVDHQGAYGVFAVGTGNRAGGFPLCGAGFPPE